MTQTHARALRRLLTVALAAAALTPNLAACAAVLPDVARNYALVVGVDRASNRPDDEIPALKFASADAQAVRDELQRTGRYEVTLLVNDKADRRAIIRSFDQIAREARPKDTFLLFFAGHGVKSPVVRRQTHWVTYGTTVPDLEVDGLRMTHVLDYVQGILAGQKLIILDHCFSGDSQWVQGLMAPPDADAAGAAVRTGSSVHFQARDLVPESDVPAELQIDAPEQGGVAIYGAAWSRAFESSATKHGLFTSVLLEAFTTANAEVSSKPGILDLNELNDFLQKWRDRPDGDGPAQKPFLWRGGTLTNWTVLDLTGTPHQIDENVDRYLGHVGALYDQQKITLSAKRHCEDAVANWKAALLQNRPPSASDLQIIGLLSRLTSDIRGRLTSDQRGAALTELLTELRLPL